MKHLDLFSGIGGFARAAEMAWNDVEHVFCDNDPFSQAILKKHWPNAPIYGDIKQLTTDSDSQRELQQEGTQQTFREWVGDGIDLLTGGFPCQPFSAAGRRAGTDDDRHLWPEMLRVIRETNPTFVLGENVGGLLTWDGGLVLEMVISDLEEAGYEAGAFVIPACALNAPHRRDRVWIAAHAIGRDDGGRTGEDASSCGEERLQERNKMEQPSESGEVWYGADPTSTRLQRTEQKRRFIERPDTHASNTSSTRSTAGVSGQDEREKGNSGITYNGCQKRNGWEREWPEVAARLCTLDDGLPNGLARPRGWRNAALKGAGNAIVPQVAAEVMKAMKEVTINVE